MFKCVECGTKYDIKPDFCDCGNDIFEIIDDEPITSKNYSQNSDSEKYENVDKISSIPQISKPSPKVEHVKTFDQQYPELAKFKNTYDPISVFVFLLCVIISFVVVFFVGNPKEAITDQNVPPKKEENVSISVPSVDSYWDNSTEGVISDNLRELEVNDENNLANGAEQPLPVAQTSEQTPQDAFSIKFEQWLNKPKREDTSSYQPTVAVLSPTQKTTTKVQTEKPKIAQQKYQNQTNNQTAKTGVQAQSKAATPQVQTKTNPQADLISRIQNSIQFSNSKQTQTKPAVQTQSTTQTTKQTSVGVTVPAVPRTIYVNTTSQTSSAAQQKPILRNAEHQQVKSQAELKQELSTYKSGLRNSVGKKINFANVVGDGNCAISFKVDSNGKLVNRNFVQQSSNITLNDAVYKAMMSTPSYNPPPEGYKNETMTLRIKIYDGNYEITLN